MQQIKFLQAKMKQIQLILKAHSLYAIKSPLKMMENAFYFTLKAHFILKIFKFLSCIFSHVEKRLD